MFMIMRLVHLLMGLTLIRTAKSGILKSCACVILCFALLVTSHYMAIKSSENMTAPEANMAKDVFIGSFFAEFGLIDLVVMPMVVICLSKVSESGRRFFAAVYEI